MKLSPTFELGPSLDHTFQFLSDANVSGQEFFDLFTVMPWKQINLF